MSWDYSFTSKARKELKKLGHEPTRKIIEFLDGRVQRADDPRKLGQALRGDLWLKNTTQAYQLRAFLTSVAFLTSIAFGGGGGEGGSHFFAVKKIRTTNPT